MSQLSTKALVTVSCGWANQAIPPFAKLTERRAIKLGSAGRNCSSNCRSIVIVSGPWRSWTIPRRYRSAASRDSSTLLAMTKIGLLFAFQLSRERTGVINFSNRLDNGGGINGDGACLCVGVNAIEHEG